MDRNERDNYHIRDIGSAKIRAQDILRASKVHDTRVIMQYTAAVMVNFTDWLGKTIPFVRHEKARAALIGNLRCEMVEDHIGMLEKFALGCNAMPGADDYTHVRPAVQNIRRLFLDPTAAGIQGLALCTALETMSVVFIPDLAKRGKRCGCTDFTYTSVHGEADKEHADDLYLALKEEVCAGYEEHAAQALVRTAIDYAGDLIETIYK